MSALLEVKELYSGYQGRPVIHGVSFHVNRGSLVCFLGPSGCGKTTVLRAVAGLETILAGEILLDGRHVSLPHTTVPPERRNVGMVFQDDTLFPHLTVADNVTFGVRRKGARSPASVAKEMLDIVGLADLSGRFPHELSGGQQQRVALARALAPNPSLILLDEAFSSLDIELRERLGMEVRDILKSRGITSILVTHDQNEAFALADQIGVMHQGSLLQWDTPYNLYHEPADRFIAEFIGHGCFIRGRVLAPDTIETEFGLIQGNRAYTWPQGSAVDVLLRPDDVQPDEDATIRASVVSKTFKGAEILYSLRLGTGSTVLSLFPSHHDHAVGEQVGIRVAADHLVAFPA